jgi:hypothetical protein
MAKKTDFAKYSSNPYSGDNGSWNLGDVASLGRNALRVYLYMVANKEEDKIVLHIQKYSVFYKLDQDVNSFKFVRGEILKGVIELLDKEYIARTYGKYTYWINPNRLWTK